VTGNRPADLVEYLTRNRDLFPERIALSHAGRRLTFAGLYRQAATLAAHFVTLGLPGRAAGIFTPTVPELAVVYYAGFMSGTTVVPINYSFRSQELRTVLENCRLHALIVHSSLVDEAQKAGGVLATIPRKYVLHGLGAGSDGFLPFGALEVPCRATFGKAAGEPAVIFHTSGTTGTPKGVVHTLESVSYFAHCYQTLCQAEPNPITLIARNCYHSGGFYHLTGALSAGTTCVLADDPARFDAEGFVVALEAHRVTQIFLSVPMLNAVLAAKNLSPRAFAHAAFVSAGADEVKAYHHEQVGKYTGLPLTVRYSSTEATCVSINASGDLSERVRTVGRPFPHFQWKLEPMRGGEGVGELLLKGKAVFRGYHNNPEANARSFTSDGWYRSGDLFKLDEAGELVFCGRMRDSLKVGGKFVYPEEIEIAANTYPAFAETIAVAVPHSVQVQVPYLFARLRPEAREFDFDDFRAFMSERIASYKVPVEVEVAEDFPRTTGGKVDRQLLAATAISAGI
jgi:long-chain acyl-CoA synthetase